MLQAPIFHRKPMLKNYFLNDTYADQALSALDARMYTREELLEVKAHPELQVDTYWLQYRRPGNSVMSGPQEFGTPYAQEDRSNLVPVIRASNLCYPEIGLGPSVARGSSALRLLKITKNAPAPYRKKHNDFLLSMDSLYSTPSEWGAHDNEFWQEPQVIGGYMSDRYKYGTHTRTLTVPATTPLGALGIIGKVQVNVDEIFFGMDKGRDLKYQTYRRPNAKMYAIFRALMGTVQETKTSVSLLTGPQTESEL